MPLATRISPYGDELRLTVSGHFSYLVATECFNLYNWAPKGTLNRVVFDLKRAESIDAYGEELLILLLERIESRGIQLFVENCPPHLGSIFDSIETASRKAAPATGSKFAALLYSPKKGIIV